MPKGYWRLWAAAYGLLGLGFLGLWLGAWRFAVIMFTASLLPAGPAAVLHWVDMLREIAREFRSWAQSSERRRNGRR